ncbi:unnamed protein product [Oikopleura dioica]|uniref:Uncharacterized protein n=1 Tax=Oikopleura dioica TaxID=34765 RepID=E4WQX6_OIKDI|nr:unnamed protein product [Oikopleura dioica]
MSNQLTVRNLSVTGCFLKKSRRSKIAMREGKRHHIMSHKQEERHMMKEYKKSEDLAKAIKRGDYGRISTHTNREGQMELITDKGQKIEKAEKRREEMEKKKAPNYASASVRAHEDATFLARCVRQVVQQYENRISSGRPFPPQAEMTVKIELIVPFGTPAHIERRLIDETPQSEIDKAPAESIIKYWSEEMIKHDFLIKKTQKNSHRQWSILVAPSEKFINLHKRL